jgi:acyl carrier protein
MGGQTRHVHVTFHGLAYIEDPVRGGSASGAAVPSTSNSTDRNSESIERDTIAIVKRLSRRPIDPTPESELMADLGFDSLQVLELVGELEDHFNIAVPLNGLTHVRTVSQIAAEVTRLVASREPSA